MDQDLRDLSEQIRNLIATMRSTSGTGATTPKDTGTEVVRSVDKMVVALAKLAVTLDGSKKTKIAEEEAIKKFTKAVDKTTDEIDKEIAERKKSEAAIKAEAKQRERNALSRSERERLELEESKQAAKEKLISNKQLYNDALRQSSGSRALFESLNGTSGTADLLKNKFLDLGGNSLKAQVGLQGVSAVLSGVSKSVISYSSALLSGKDAATASAEAFTNLVDPLAKFLDTLGMIVSAASFFVPGGALVKGAVAVGGALLGLGSSALKAAAKFNEIGTTQLKAVLNSYNTLSQAGIGLSNGMEGTFGLMQTLGMTTAEADKFNDLLAKNNKQLALMSGTAATGAKRFADVAGTLYKSDIGRSFEMMGITADEQREAALQYMSIQARTGQLQLKNTQQLVQESAKFVEELDQAAQLTGTTRKEQQEAREAAMAETRFRAALIDAEKRGDKAEQTRLQNAQKMAAIAKAAGDERGFTGILQAAAGGGALTTPEARAAEMTYGVNEILSKGEQTQTQIYEQMVKNAGQTNDMLVGINKFAGNVDAIQTSLIGIDNLTRQGNNIAEEAMKAGFTGATGLSDYMEAQKKLRAAPTGDKGAMVDANRAAKSAALVMEKGISKLNIAADINKKAAETFADAVKEFKGITGEVPGGLPTYGAAAVKKAESPAVPTANDKAVTQAKEQRVTAEQQVTELQKQRELLEKEKGRGNEEVKKARIEEAKARRAAERARANELTAQRRQGFSRVLTPGISQTGAMPGPEAMPATGGQTPANTAPAPVNAQGPKQVSLFDYIKFGNSTGDLAHFNQLDPAVATAFANMARDYNQMFPGQLLQINSAFRSPEEQAGVDSGNNPKAAPGKSLHQQGRAIDIQSAQVQQLAQAGLLNQYGFKTLANDPPHIYMKDGGIAHGPTDGYPATLHGTEAVIPLKNGSVPVMMPSLDQMVSATEAVNQQVQTLKDELTGMMREIATALSNNNTAGSQERMIQILENIARSQNQTATASKRLASVAIN